MTRSTLATLLLTLTGACSVMAPPSGQVQIDGPEGSRDSIELAVDAWASHGAAVVVGQIGPCGTSVDADPCRRDVSPVKWSVVVVQDGTKDGEGAVLCDPKAESVVYASTDFDSQTIWVGQCARNYGVEAEVISHEVGHVLLGSDHHSNDGVMVSSDPVTVEPGLQTLKLACSLGWGC